MQPEIQWECSQTDSCHDLTRVYGGTKDFEAVNPGKLEADKCLVLVSRRETLYLEAKSARIRDYWVRSLLTLIGEVLKDSETGLELNTLRFMYKPKAVQLLVEPSPTNGASKIPPSFIQNPDMLGTVFSITGVLLCIISAVLRIYTAKLEGVH